MITYRIGLTRISDIGNGGTYNKEINTLVTTDETDISRISLSFMQNEKDKIILKKFELIGSGYIFPQGRLIKEFDND